jgi:1,4-dihydroxy-2-naphthoate octaprenyltransferase
MSANSLSKPQSRVAVWVSALRPATLLAGVAPVMVGASLAWSHESFAWLPSLAALAGALLIQVATNFINDYADHRRGADGVDRLGPPRAASQGWLSPQALLRAALFCLLLTAFIGVYLTAVGGLPILLLGLASLICAFAYTAGPFPLAYLGLGDIFVIAFFGLGAVCGTYFLNLGRVGLGAVLAGFAVGCLATAILVVNNLRDALSDAKVEKRTLIVRFGDRFGRIEHAVLLLLPYVFIAYGLVSDALPLGAGLVLLSAPLALREIHLLKTLQGAQLNPRLGGAARLEFVFCLCFSVGCLL